MDDARLLETLESFCARICHDLVGPVGAIANGVELLTEDGASLDGEVVALIAGSARSASRRLQFFRGAFGAGNTVSGGQPLEGARALAIPFFEDGKLRLAWPAPPPALEARADRSRARLILNLLLVAADCLPRGGELDVDIVPEAGDELGIAIRAQGNQARLADENRAALGAEGPALPPGSPRAIPAWLARLVLVQLGGRLGVEEQPGSVRLSVRLPARR
jgi:histidine phosphotransferase ChpT